ncbi:MAG: GNAT family N-acetyltransferase [Saprospiraceae bacterium]|nr:GNAT family N-acetyltransferase [Saprospiraceae bacterium]
MQEPVHIKHYSHPYFDQVFLLLTKLFDKSPITELRLMIEDAANSDSHLIKIALNSNDQVIGFALASIRSDYVEGAKQSPTGYLEAIYIEEAYRKLGIARTFIEKIEAWATEKGCVQLGSDTWLTDTQSRNFHKKVGFWEEDELVHFLKDIK